MRTALVTGVNGGIGRPLRRALSAAGYRVVGTDLTADPTFPGDVAVDLNNLANPSNDGLARLIEAVGENLDLLVNNAAYQVVNSVTELSVEEWQRTLNVNLTAPFLLTRAFLPQLRRSGCGSVVNISSIHATLTKPGFSAYATSKGALSTLTRALAVELAPGVRVNALAPAATDTPMLRAGLDDDPALLATLGGVHPMGRIATPDEVAAAVVFLASKEAAFINGAVLPVDGGIGGRLHDVR